MLHADIAAALANLSELDKLYDRTMLANPEAGEDDDADEEGIIRMPEEQKDALLDDVDGLKEVLELADAGNEQEESPPEDQDVVGNIEQEEEFADGNDLNQLEALMGDIQGHLDGSAIFDSGMSLPKHYGEHLPLSEHMEYGAQIQEKPDKPSGGVACSEEEEDEDFEPEQSIAGKAEYLREWQQTFPWDKQVEDANKMIFGNTDFRECQREIINATKSGRDALALIPTGGGKSLTFQLSAVTD